MNRVVLESGEARVKIAVEEMICIIASRMKWGDSSLSSAGSSGFSGSSSPPEGAFGELPTRGVGKSTGNFDSMKPIAGIAGMVPLCACSVREVL